jgi:hypothetical protein
MIDRNKNYCSIHHLYYKGDVCPFCLAEKHERMSKSYYQKPKDENKEKVNDDKPIEVTEDILQKLSQHFKK